MRDKAKEAPWITIFVLIDSQGEMLLGCWRLVNAVGESELPMRLMYRAVGVVWRDPVQFQISSLGSNKPEGEEVQFWNKATTNLPLLKVPQTWMDPMRNKLKALAIAEGCNPQRKRADVSVVVYINRIANRRLVDQDAQDILDEMTKLDQENSSADTRRMEMERDATSISIMTKYAAVPT
nr:hypothetical protein L203_02022 [Cryptococcus depauperatus CBS 7841]